MYYSTSFPNTETPISDGGKWLNGLADGGSWGNVNTTPGQAVGTSFDSGGLFNDSTAVVQGSWLNDYTVSGTIFISGTLNRASHVNEIELRVRTNISSNLITGYELLYSLLTGGTNRYCQMVRWNNVAGTGHYTILADFTPNADLADGDILSATVSGTTISFYRNGSLITDGGTQFAQVTDSTFASGLPGIGMYNAFGTGDNGLYGFTQFTAFDANGAGDIITKQLDYKLGIR